MSTCPWSDRFHSWSWVFDQGDWLTLRVEVEHMPLCSGLSQNRWFELWAHECVIQSDLNLTSAPVVGQIFTRISINHFNFPKMNTIMSIEHHPQAHHLQFLRTINTFNSNTFTPEAQTRQPVMMYTQIGMQMLSLYRAIVSVSVSLLSFIHSSDSPTSSHHTAYRYMQYNHLAQVKPTTNDLQAPA